MVMNKTTSTEGPSGEQTLSEIPGRRSVVSSLPAAKAGSAQARNKPRIVEEKRPTVANAVDILRDIARMFAEKHETSTDDLLTHALSAERKAAGLQPQRLGAVGTVSRRSKHSGQLKRTHC